MNLAFSLPINCPFPRASGKSKSNANQQGSILFGFLLLVSVVVLALSLFSIRWAQVYDSQKLRSICRAELQKTYSEIGEKTESLLQINNVAKALKTEEIAARAALAAALLTVFAPGIEAAKLWLRSIQMRRKFYRGRQQYLIHSGNLLLMGTPRRIFAKLKSQPRYLGLVERDIQPRMRLPVRMAVRKADQDPELPTYELLPQYERRQAMELKWHSRFKKTSAEEGTWSIANISLPESCGMTLKPSAPVNRPGKFKTMPTQDRYFWKR